MIIPFDGHGFSTLLLYFFVWVVTALVDPNWLVTVTNGSPLPTSPLSSHFCRLFWVTEREQMMADKTWVSDVWSILPHSAACSRAFLYTFMICLWLYGLVRAQRLLAELFDYAKSPGPNGLISFESNARLKCLFWMVKSEQRSWMPCVFFGVQIS